MPVAKHLERHRFVWPPLVEGGVVLTPAQFALLVEAMDWRRTVAPPAPRLPVQMGTHINVWMAPIPA